MSSPFQAAIPLNLEGTVPEKKQEQNDPINQKITSIMNFINSWEKNENDVAKIWELLKMYFTFLEDIQHILVPIIQKVYSIQNETKLIPLLSKIGNISTSVDLLDVLIQLRTNVQLLSPEEVELLRKVRLEFQENRSVLLIIKDIISRLDQDNRNLLESKFSKAMQPYNKSQEEPQPQEKKHVSFLDNEVTIPVVSKKMKTKWIIAIVVVVLLLLAGGGYFLYMQKGGGSFEGGGAASGSGGSDGYITDASQRSLQSSIGGSS